jgi:hypothetical protein
MQVELGTKKGAWGAWVAVVAGAGAAVMFLLTALTMGGAPRGSRATGYENY